MAGELLLINPRARRKARKARKGAARKRSRNPIKVNGFAPVKRRMRRRNPVAAFARRRRRNPISVGSARASVAGLMTAVKDAAIGGAGAVAVDVAYGQVAPMLPAVLQRKPGQITAGDAVKAVFAYLLGTLLAKPTRGLSRKMAAGALTVQASDMLRTFVPGTLTLGGLGYMSPARVVAGSARVSPNPGLMSPSYTRPALLNGVGAYVPARSTLNGSPRFVGAHSQRRI